MAGNIFGGKYFWREIFLAGNIFGGKYFWQEIFLEGNILGKKYFLAGNIFGGNFLIEIILKSGIKTKTKKIFIKSQFREMAPKSFLSELVKNHLFNKPGEKSLALKPNFVKLFLSF